jgi:hypothetical protein
MPQSNEEARLLLTLQALQSNPELKLRSTAKTYEVDYYALHRRQKGIQSRRSTIPNSWGLSNLEEEIIVYFIFDIFL